MSYVDGFVIAVKTSNREAYKEYVLRAAPVFKRHGAISFVECWGDDVPDGKLTSFPMAVKLEPDETVVFAWIVWPSKEVRNTAMEKIMAEPESDPRINPWPFDTKRMIYGGFVPLVEA
jgi:uncharacterized protein YbaA (DUF1428 family)